jgi:queuine tRNA-ribosyltransferase
MIFRVDRRDPATRARTGLLALGHGSVATPCFMPVGTNAGVKAVKHQALEDMGTNLILSNSYHLYLRPGAEVIRAAGGLHRFMSWRHNLLTDSGGFQVFSLAPFRRVDEEGVSFRSHLDGSSHRLTPESVVDFQILLGSDVLMPLDVCTGPGIGPAEARDAVRTTTRWLARSADRWSAAQTSMKGLLFGILQGNFFPDLRAESAEGILPLNLPGYAIGGLSVGEPEPLFLELLRTSAGLLPEDKPRYLMGVGTPDYILAAVEAGVDMFDCVLPTRVARNAAALTRRGLLSLKAERNRLDFQPIDPACRCPTCREHSRAYLRHLFKAREIQAAVLATHHNLHFMHTFMQEIRQAINDGRFADYKREFLAEYAGGP